MFLAGCGLPEVWEGRERFTIAETGFGTGLNFLAAWQLRRESGWGGHLHFVSIEKYPLSHGELAAALSAFPELSDLTEALLAVWPGRVKGTHRLEFEGVTLDLWHCDVAEALGEMRLRADAWFLDGFSPAKNPDMWSESNISRLAGLSTPGAQLASFTVAGHVRRALLGSGWEVSREPGFGRKRHRLEARLPGEAPAPDIIRPVIVGSGIAGASVARAFLREGIVPTVIRSPDHDDIAASGNPLALVKPRLDKQDRPESRFFLSAWLYARNLYRAVECGIRHYPKSEGEATRFRAIIEQRPLPPDDLRWEGGHLFFPTAPVIDPVATCEGFLKGAEVIAADVTGWARDGEGWRVDTSVGMLSGSHLVLASGLHLKSAFPELALRASRGQLSWALAEIDAPATYGGYAIPHGGRVLLGATHDRLDGDDPYRLEPGDDARNAALLQERLGVVATDTAPARASVRVNSADTLPILDEIEPGLWVLGALGSRGFSHAPLLGAELVSRTVRPATSQGTGSRLHVRGSVALPRSQSARLSVSRGRGRS